MRRVYLDNNATTPMDPAVHRVCSKLTCFGNPSSRHCLGLQGKQTIDRARKKIAGILHCEPQEMIFTSCATESNNLVIQGVVRNLCLKKKVTILYSAIEHPSVFNCIRFVCKHPNVCFRRLKVFPNGEIDLCYLRHLLTHIPSVKLLCVIFANHEIGTVQNMPEIVKLARKHKVWLHSDMTQAIGKMGVNLQKLGVDSASFSAHKFYGPKGVGGLYIHHKKRKQIQQLMFGGNQEYLIRPGTENVQGIVGMATALAICKQRKYDWKHAQELREELIGLLHKHRAKLPKFVVNQSTLVIPGTVSISFENVDGNKLIQWLSCKHGICISRGSACKAHSKSGSNVLEALDIPERFRMGTLRVGIGRFNTVADIRKLARLLVQFMKEK